MASLKSLFVCFIKNGHRPSIDILHNISSLPETLKIKPSMAAVQSRLDRMVLMVIHLFMATLLLKHNFNGLYKSY